MEYLIKNGNKVEFRNQNLIYVNSEKLDEQAIHINFETQTNLFFALQIKCLECLNLPRQVKELFKEFRKFVK